MLARAGIDDLEHPEAITEAIPDAGNALLTLPVDVTNASQAAAAVSATLARFGRIDSLVNDAGRGLLGAVEEVSDAEARAVFDVNVFGLLTVTRAVLPVMRKQGAGRIINISSSGGFIGRAGWGVYCSTKFAVEGLSESMGHELAPLGIQVTAIEPGAFRTNFRDDSSLITAAARIQDHTGTAGVTRQWAEQTNYAQAGDPVKAAKVIVDLAGREGLPERIQLGQVRPAGVLHHLSLPEPYRRARPVLRARRAAPVRAGQCLQRFRQRYG